MKQKLSRKKKHRQMMLRNLATSIIIYEKIKTTTAKAKAVKGIIDKVVNCGKKNDLSAHRKLNKYLLDKNAVKKVHDVLVPRYAQRHSGFTHIYKIGSRLGDGSPIVLLQLLSDDRKNKNLEIVDKDNVKKTAKK